MTDVPERASAWAYRGIWRALTSYFRVPEEPPTLPGSAADTVSFRPAPGFLRYLRFWFWVALTVIDLAILVGWLLILAANWILGLALLPVALVLAIVPDVFAYLALHLRYDTTWYVMSDRSLRIRRGIWSIRETTITFENVQNVKIQQGPVQRHFGFANLVVETAGGGGSAEAGGGGSANQGVIEGVDNAPELRDRILRRLRDSSSAGLGDDEATPPPTSRPALSAAHLDVLREIRDQVRRLSA
jgi:membrane protein YdbS with pleckstrin-like domain